jgi:hypothetical protein
MMKTTWQKCTSQYFSKQGRDIRRWTRSGPNSTLGESLRIRIQQKPDPETKPWRELWKDQPQQSKHCPQKDFQNHIHSLQTEFIQKNLFNTGQPDRMDTRTLSAQTTSRKEECKKRLIKASLAQSKPNLIENVKRPASAEKQCPQKSSGLSPLWRKLISKNLVSTRHGTKPDTENPLAQTGSRNEPIKEKNRGDGQSEASDTRIISKSDSTELSAQCRTKWQLIELGRSKTRAPS